MAASALRAGTHKPAACSPLNSALNAMVTIQIEPKKPKILVLANTLLTSGVLGWIASLPALFLFESYLVAIVIGALVGFLALKKFTIKYFCKESVFRSYIWLITMIVFYAMFLPTFVIWELS
ncbi:MAG: hypothetical protein ACN2B6_01000 [Rickettsiales bacterium]